MLSSDFLIAGYPLALEAQTRRTWKCHSGIEKGSSLEECVVGMDEVQSSNSLRLSPANDHPTYASASVCPVL